MEVIVEKRVPRSCRRENEVGRGGVEAKRNGSLSSPRSKKQLHNSIIYSQYPVEAGG